MTRRKLEADEKRTNIIQMSFNTSEFAFLEAEAQKAHRPVAVILRRMFEGAFRTEVQSRIQNGIRFTVAGRPVCLPAEEAADLAKDLFQKLQNKIRIK